MRKGCLLTGLLVILSLGGCLPSIPETSAPPASGAASPPPAAAPSSASPAPAPSANVATPPAAAPAPGNQNALLPPTPQQSIVPPALAPPANMPSNLPPGTQPGPPPGDMVRAGVGVGVKGRSLDHESGVLVTPAKAYFTLRERAIFDISIPQAVSLFEGTEGRKPKSQEEFMTRIVQANNIQLPQLAPGSSYYYDAQQGELMVVRPRPVANPAPK